MAEDHLFVVEHDNFEDSIEVSKLRVERFFDHILKLKETNPVEAQNIFNEFQMELSNFNLRALEVLDRRPDDTRSL